MKAVFIIFDEAIDAQVMTLLSEQGIEQYTKFPKLLGAGSHSEPHLNDLIWPGANTGMLILIDDQKVAGVLEQFKALKQRHLKEGVKVFVLAVEEVI